MDLSLTVKSEFDNVYNESLEKALKHYLKPEYLTSPNLYFCEICNEKVEAVKGLRFSSLSDILTIQLNRFELDLQTFTRKKVNNWVSYPFVLDMNNFMRPYDEIIVNEDTEFLKQEPKIETELKPTLIRHIDGDFEDPLRRRKRTNRKPSPDEEKKT
jgi:ubiquitin carboxyl-terminal hydrolase 47